ncbi:MAG: ATPase domain-containing protein [Candidatus Bathyarchaeia archaeon]
MSESTPTGVDGLDRAIGGGFPKGSLVIVAGNPGTGKTTFGVEFLSEGWSRWGERGLHVSFSESTASLTATFGPGFGKCCDEGGVRILDFIPLRDEGASAITEAIIREAISHGAKRLVVDSLNALTQSMDPKEVRTFLQAIFGRVVRQMGCTTIMTLEVPLGSEGVGLGIEEFVADGLILLRRGDIEGRIFRELEIIKLRGRKIERPKMAFTLEGGFRAIPQFAGDWIGERGKFEPMPDPKGGFSTGNEGLDALLGGGFRAGSFALLELGPDLPRGAYNLIRIPIWLNFIANGNRLLAVPNTSASARAYRSLLIEFMDEGKFDKSAKIAELAREGPLEPYAFRLSGRSASADCRAILRILRRLKGRDGGKCVVYVGWDAIDRFYGPEGRKLLALLFSEVKYNGDLLLGIVKPGTSFIDDLRRSADYYLKLVLLNGAPCLYGVKPRTAIYHFERDPSKNYPKCLFTEIV